MGEDVGWETDNVSRNCYSIVICRELPWRGIWKRWFSSDSCPEAQRKRLVLSSCTVGLFLLAELGVLVGRQEMLASVSACSLHGGIQLPQIPSAMSLSCHCPHQGAFVRMQCRERGIPGGCSPHSCLSKSITLWGTCSFSIRHKWDAQRQQMWC